MTVSYLGVKVTVLNKNCIQKQGNIAHQTITNEDQELSANTGFHQLMKATVLAESSWTSDATEISIDMSQVCVALFSPF